MTDQMEVLVSKYPHVFSHIKHVECDEGWYPLLECLFFAIEQEISNLPEELRDAVYLEQAKEKFASLRVYMSQTTPYIDGAIRVAEGLSRRICEVCGNRGEQRGGGWIKTLCDQHHEEREAAKRARQ